MSSRCAVDTEKFYKYPGYQKSKGTAHSAIKRHVTEKYEDRIKRIFRTQLSGKNEMKVMNVFAKVSLLII